ncbi:MAG: hypothetical protein Q7S27_02020 [Nanoarchaeota archaeon]|nr:hypothetical protein [Nanoarchaeota archaeon]
MKRGLSLNNEKQRKNSSSFWILGAVILVIVILAIVTISNRQLKYPKDKPYNLDAETALGLRKEIDLTFISLNGDAKIIPKGVLLTENKSASTKDSSAYWDSKFMMKDNYKTLSFDFNFIKSGSADKLEVWIDDKIIYIAEGYLTAGKGMQQALGAIDLSNLKSGLHTLRVLLHPTGEEDTQVTVSNFIVSYIP